MKRFNLRKALTALTLGLALAVPTMLPADASAKPQSRRQKTKNTWRNLGYAGAAAGVAGLVTHNKALAIGGLAGGAYSAYRYEHDRKSQSRANSRARSRRISRHYRTARHHR